MIKIWKKVRGTFANAMLIMCAVWAIAGLNFAEEDPDLLQVGLATMAGIVVLSWKVEWE